MARESPLHDFGSYIAYLIPGATLLAGLQPFSATLQSWFATAPAESPTIGGFLYLTVASLAAGMTISAVRWAVVDTIHAKTGLRAPALDFSLLGKNVEAYRLLIEIHYRHYLCYANLFVAVAIAYPAYRSVEDFGSATLGIDVGVAVLEAVFFLTSRDTARKYYQRTAGLLRSRASRTQGRENQRVRAA